MRYVNCKLLQGRPLSDRYSKWKYVWGGKIAVNPWPLLLPTVYKPLKFLIIIEKLSVNGDVLHPIPVKPHVYFCIFLKEPVSTKATQTCLSILSDYISSTKEASRVVSSPWFIPDFPSCCLLPTALCNRYQCVFCQHVQRVSCFLIRQIYILYILWMLSIVYMIFCGMLYGITVNILLCRGR